MTAIPLTIHPPDFANAVAAMDRGDITDLEHHLTKNPALLTTTAQIEGEDPGSYFHAPRLMWFIAENPIRTGRLPANVTDVLAHLITASQTHARHDLPEVATYTLALAASGRIVAESGLIAPLATQLIAAGADPNPALRAALGHQEMAAADALVDQGATPTPAYHAAKGDAAALANTPSSPEALQDALAAATLSGHAHLIAPLVEAGANPRINCPHGFHAHATPLHQAALAGDTPTARALLAAGADPSARDTAHNATPAGWATHAGHTSLANLLIPDAT